MNKIPKKLKEEMSRDPFYRQCAIEGGGRLTADKFDPERIEWHHNLIFASKQVQEKFAIIPIKKRLHDHMTGEVKERCDWIMWNRATAEEISRYSKAKDHRRELDRLNKKYGVWKPHHEKRSQTAARSLPLR